ncbi:NADH ubiquinone oxidoreductase subunit NDUFA12 domain-containing protein [Hirsutella rhossiliensis]|uniref:NADH ubiquinone oxidoreductase subunit NDUFA12 domain-containing protein n=1 Tax=Hirsutella rhossiliensis TaxID=111463 RepID=A0A9P8MXE1_9HYPO|nr:NADH ubiquinone oxidoreductase subunit NDUFA12 domain-containing protein [Hirsutella rhossiliensis]KAH0963010.1 NADH ubiquinone oxidoreductase subunit NDUFA12 domain-containing protein [Hirsutella rhossiliensis]
MAPKRIGPLAQAWHAWKALQLPWRKRFFVGYDLQGNTYWQFRLTTRGPPSDYPDSHAATEPWRRIVHYPRSMPYSEVKVSPLWHQWLRQTRHEPPSLAEQRDDVQRQERIKLLAAQADARWEAKPRVTDSPVDALPGGPQPAQQSQAPRFGRGQQRVQPPGKDDPETTTKARGPGENWQPAPWNPR